MSGKEVVASYVLVYSSTWKPDKTHSELFFSNHEALHFSFAISLDLPGSSNGQDAGYVGWDERREIGMNAWTLLNTLENEN